VGQPPYSIVLDPDLLRHTATAKLARLVRTARTPSDCRREDIAPVRLGPERAKGGLGSRPPSIPANKEVQGSYRGPHFPRKTPTNLWQSSTMGNKDRGKERRSKETKERPLQTHPGTPRRPWSNSPPTSCKGKKKGSRRIREDSRDVVHWESRRKANLAFATHLMFPADRNKTIPTRSRVERLFHGTYSGSFHALFSSVLASCLKSEGGATEVSFAAHHSNQAYEHVLTQ